MKCPNCGSANCEQTQKGTGEKTIDYIGFDPEMLYNKLYVPNPVGSELDY